VFWTEDGDKLYAVGMGEEVNRAPSFRVNAGLVRNHTYVFAFERLEILLLEHVYTGLRRGGSGLRRILPPGANARRKTR
jgi:hypothetical protein